MENKKNNNIIIIFAIISLVIGIGFIIYFFYYYHIRLTIIIVAIITLLIMGVILYIPYKIAENKQKLVDELFIVDIFNKGNNEHIRITKEKNILFTYKNVIKYYYIFPKLVSDISLKGKIWETPTYDIKDKTQLMPNELNEILEKINKLNHNENGDTIVNYKGCKKSVDKNEINKIFINYFAY